MFLLGEKFRVKLTSRSTTQISIGTNFSNCAFLRKKTKKRWHRQGHPYIMADKRKEPPTSAGNGGAIAKRQRQTVDGTNGSSNALAIAAGGGQQRGVVIQAVKRTSALRAPIMELTGHTGEVFACRFDTSGNHIASGSFDRSIRKAGAL
jgi:hypothetical protein